jgi:alpha-beta hydrolase superfamily lysophospholipase
MKMFPEKTLKGIGAAVLRILLLTYVIFGIMLYVRQDKYLFYPPSISMEDCAEIPNAKIIIAEGTRAYYVQAGTSTKIAVTYHGNGERACDSAYLVNWFVQHGYNVLAVEYAGYAGDLSQKPSVELLLRDTEHMNAWVEKGGYSHMIILGRSIGTGFASYHASLASPKKLILISPFDTLSRLAWGHFPVYPASLFLKTELNNVTNASFAKHILIIHGADDVVVPFARGKSLFEKLPQEKKTFISIEGVAHNDVLDTGKSWSAIKSFVE